MSWTFVSEDSLLLWIVIKYFRFCFVLSTLVTKYNSPLSSVALQMLNVFFSVLSEPLPLAPLKWTSWSVRFAASDFLYDF